MYQQHVFPLAICIPAESKNNKTRTDCLLMKKDAYPVNIIIDNDGGLYIKKKKHFNYS
jgi:phosphoribosyl 1,2-cyclic phosphodiesterase